MSFVLHFISIAIKVVPKQLKVDIAVTNTECCVSDNNNGKHKKLAPYHD